MQAETESKRQESQVRLRLKSHQLKRFHEQLCLRVTARERQNRLEVQRAQQHLQDAKCAKLFAKTTTVQDPTDIASVRVSSRPFFQDLKEQKRVILKDCPLATQIEKVGQQLSLYQALLTNLHNADELPWHGKLQSLRLDAQCRDVLLLSMESSRSHCAESGDEYSINAEEIVDVPGQSPVLRPEQRAALYATVRRQFMEMDRVNAQSGTAPGASQSPVVGTAKSTPRNKPVAAASRGSKARHSNQEEIKGGERRSATPTAVKVYD
ncbi:hypothetical protein BBJ28_00006826 [Nothophytophthora sp. Chile5]|nr:hypothetical protein BBJ28_00006826 [Nothophytophthora sp. Chile5]